MYYVAKQLAGRPCSPEEFGAALARHFVHTYPATVWKAKVAGEVGALASCCCGGASCCHGLAPPDPPWRGHVPVCRWEGLSATWVAWRAASVTGG